MSEARLLQSFGRRQGRRLRAHQSGLMETLLPRLRITLPDVPVKTPLWFEIGFGGGEHLVEQARRNPAVNFIGCEPYVNGMAKLLASIDAAGLTNLRLYDGDARTLMEHLPDGLLERLFVLFPDPWPKARHHKRRIISQEGLALFHRKLKPGGLLRLVTDHVDYGTWMLEQLLAFKGFEWAARRSADWKTPPADWVRTRYQAKAEAEGRCATFFDWVKPSS